MLVPETRILSNSYAAEAPWLGEIPSDWEVRPLRAQLRRARRVVGRNSSKHQLLSLTLRGVIVRDLSQMKGKFPASFDTYQEVLPGDFVFCLFDVEETPRTVGMSRHGGMITGAYDVYTGRGGIADRYLERLLLSFDSVKSLQPLYRGLRKTVPRGAFESLRICWPSSAEQELIVRYLDNAELRIARAIDGKESLLGLLAERRAAVTGELLRRSAVVDRADSGIPGLGSVPAQWQIVPVKKLWKPIDARSTTGLEERLTVSSREGIVPRSARRVTMFEASSYVGHKLVEPNQLVINSLWAWAGGLGVSSLNGLVSPVYGVYAPRDSASLDIRYFHALFRSDLLQWQFQVNSRGIWRSRLQLTDERFLDMKIPVPALEEQREIAARIDSATVQTDEAMAAVQREIALLCEFRTKLVSDVVTGKKDVRAEAASMKDVDPAELAAALAGGTASDDTDLEVNDDAE